MAERQITPLGHKTHIIRSAREWEMWLRYIRTLECEGKITGELWGSHHARVMQFTAPSDLTGEVLEPLVADLLDNRREKLGEDFPFGRGNKCDPQPLFGSSGIRLLDGRDAQFSVYATQNPVEQQGTYPLSEAQTDRFALKSIVRYPDFDAMRRISGMANAPKSTKGDPDEEYCESPRLKQTREICYKRDIALRSSLYFFRRCRELILGTSDSKVGSMLGALNDNRGESRIDWMDRMTCLVFLTHLRMPAEGASPAAAAALLADREQSDRMKYLHLHRPDLLALVASRPEFRYVDNGASPRGVIQLTRAALCHAFVDGSKELRAVDIRKVAPDVLRHRIRLNAQARFKNLSVDQFVRRLVTAVLE
jgi:hypothetical protein